MPDAVKPVSHKSGIPPVYKILFLYVSWLAPVQGEYGFYGGDQVAITGWLDEKKVGPKIIGRINIGRSRGTRKYNDRDRFQIPVGPDGCQALEPILARHIEIQENKIGDIMI